MSSNMYYAYFVGVYMTVYAHTHRHLQVCLTLFLRLPDPFCTDLIYITTPGSVEGSKFYIGVSIPLLFLGGPSGFEYPGGTSQAVHLELLGAYIVGVEDSGLPR